MNKNQIDKMDPYIKNFILTISEKNISDRDELHRLWDDIIKKKKQRKNTRSAYQNFCAQTRPDIKKEDPSLSFGQVASLLGQRWKQLSDDDRVKFAVIATDNNPPIVATDNNPPVVATDNHPPVIATESNTPNTVIDTTQYKLGELRKMCENNNLPTSTKRSIMIETLRTHNLIKI